MIVLDTHVLVWWVAGGDGVSVAARAALDAERRAAAGSVLVSAISAWEIAMLVQRERLVLSMALDEWWDAVRRIERLTIVPLSDDLLMESTRLPGEFHKDAADRFIVALARERNVPLLTSDAKILAYPGVKSIW